MNYTEEQIKEAKRLEIEQIDKILKKRKDEFEANYQLVYTTRTNSRIGMQYKKEQAEKRS